MFSSYSVSFAAIYQGHSALTISTLGVVIDSTTVRWLLSANNWDWKKLGDLRAFAAKLGLALSLAVVVNYLGL